MTSQPKFSSAKGMQKVIANFVVVDEDGTSHNLGRVSSIGSAMYFHCGASPRDSKAPLLLGKGPVTCLMCLTAEFP